MGSSEHTYKVRIVDLVAMQTDDVSGLADEAMEDLVKSERIVVDDEFYNTRPA
jgi:hypothetical protein